MKALALLILLLLAGCARSPHPVQHKRVIAIAEPPAEVVAPTPSIPDTSYLAVLFGSHELVNVLDVDSTIVCDLRYASGRNFLKRDFYDGLRSPFLVCEAAWKLATAQFLLKTRNPNYSIVILDATRPQHVQQLMWDSLAMHPDVKYNYLAPPYETSLHNYGCAVDVTIRNDSSRAELDMGTDFDTFEKLAQPAFEERFLKSGELSPEALANRKLLRSVMLEAGFRGIQSEWWHFSICQRAEAMKRFTLVK